MSSKTQNEEIIDPNGLDLFRLTMMVITASICGGIFSLAGDMAAGGANTGAVIVSWGICFIGVFALMMVFNGLSQARPDLTGGIYAYAAAGFGDYIGFNSAWGYWISACLSNVSFALLLFSALGYFFPAFGAGNNLLSIVCASAFLWFLTALVLRGVYSVVFGDIFMKCVYRLRPYETVPGAVDAMHRKWAEVCKEFVSSGYPSRRKFKKLCRQIIEDFDNNIELLDVKKPRVGVVGEILVKFLPAANNHLVDLLESEGAEAVVPDLLDFLQYCFYNQNFKVEKLGFAKSKATAANWGIKVIDWFRAPATEAFKKSKHFNPPADIRDLGKMASDIVSLGNQTGEGWFLTGEMLELIHSGAPNIVCTQPFACLPNHVVGKGVIKELRRRYPQSNIVAIDFDPGASEVNQLNRIKLMLSTANKNLEA